MKKISAYSGRIVFDHLAKSGGMSVTEWLRGLLGSGAVSPDLTEDHLALISRYGGKHSLLCAHIYFQGEGLDPRYHYFTVLREPVDRVISWLFYAENTTPNTQGFVEHKEAAREFIQSDGEIVSDLILSSVSNYYVSHFSGITMGPRVFIPDIQRLIAATESLKEYDIVGVFEQMPFFVTDVADFIGVSNTTQLARKNQTNRRPSVDEISDSLRKRIIELNQLDLRLYHEILAWKASSRVAPQKEVTRGTALLWDKYEPTSVQTLITPDLILVNVELRNGYDVQYGQVMIFDVVFRTTRDIGELIVGISLLDESKRWAFGTNSTMLKQSNSKISIGTHRVTYYLGAELPIGKYFAGFSFAEICSTATVELAWHDDLVEFSVYRAKDTRVGIGYVELPAKISLILNVPFVKQNLVLSPKGRLECIDSGPWVCRPNETLTFNVRLFNESSQDWESDHFFQINLCPRWHNLAHDTQAYDAKRTDILGLFAGSSLDVSMLVVAPNVPGDYNLILTVVQENSGWFDLLAEQFVPAHLNVTVEPAQCTEVMVPFELDKNCDDLEVRLWVPAGSDLAVQSLVIEPAVGVQIGVAEAVVVVTPKFSPQENDRIAMTVSCRDCAALPKVPGAGQVSNENGLLLQQMHDGTRVLAGGYYGEWMQTVIQKLAGHHEPQEELLFHTLLRQARPGSLMVEFGCYWAFYSNWYLGAVPQSRAICIEPDANRMQVGQQNFKLNQREAEFYRAAAGGQYQAETAFVRESDGQTVNIPIWDFAKLVEQVGIGCIELLHMDTHGAELPFLQSIGRTPYHGHLRFVVVSTHHQCISGSATTHRDCLATLINLGAFILCEHSVEESYSGDGLIVASFHAEDAAMVMPHISRNQPESSFFGPDPKRAVKPYTVPVDDATASNLLQDLTDQIEVVRTADGPMQIFKADSVIGASLKSSGAFQTDKIDEVLGFLTQRFAFKPELFVDIGANIGTHVVHALKGCGFTRGLAFEPDPHNHALLSQNIAAVGLADRVQAFKLALSSRSGAATFELCGSNFGDHRVRVAGAQPGVSFGEDQRRIISVLTDAGDDFFEEHDLTLSMKTLMWVDTQGHEGHVFTGLSKQLSASQKPIIVCEFWPYGLERAGGKKIFFDFLSRCSVLYDINRPNWQDSSEYSLHRLEKLYQTMLSDTRDGHYPHTDLLCIL